MAEKNTAQAARAKHAQHGGARPGAGRKWGLPDKVPRKPKKRVADRFKELQLELAVVMRERDDALKREADLRDHMNYGQRWSGDSKGLIEATMRGDYHPEMLQWQSAKALLDKEYPPNLAAETDETGRVVCFLPNNRRDPDLAANDEDAQWVTAQLDRQWKATRIGRDEQLKKWIAEGVLHEDRN